MEVQYKLSAGMGVYLGFNFMGEMSPQLMQNKASKKRGNYVEGVRLGRLPLHLAMQDFHGYEGKLKR